jgi:hypothetical protein
MLFVIAKYLCSSLIRKDVMSPFIERGEVDHRLEHPFMST